MLVELIALTPNSFLLGSSSGQPEKLAHIPATAEEILDSRISFNQKNEVVRKRKERRERRYRHYRRRHSSMKLLV